MNQIIEAVRKKEDLRQKASEAMKYAPSMRNYGNSPLLCKVGDFIYSYNTCVAVFVYDDEDRWIIVVPRYHSTTTSRHINKIANDFNTEVIKLY